MGDTVTFGRYRVSISRRELWKDGEPEDIGRRALEVLVVLLRRRGELVTKDDLASEVWAGAAVEDNTIAAQIATLRRALGDGAQGVRYIQTVPGRGYRFVAPLDCPAAEALPSQGREATSPSPNDGRRSGPPVRPGPLVLSGLAAVAALAAIVLWRLTPGAWEIDHMETVAESPLVETEAAPSPDGKMLAYAAGPERDHRRIFLTSLTVGEPLAFTAGDGDEAAPAWAPAGDRIAFVRGRDGQPCVILVKPLLAGPEREVGRCRTLRATTLVWSRDGAALYFHDRPTAQAPSRIMRLDVGTGVVTAVTNPPPGSDGDVTPGLSPNGRRLVFQRSTDLVTAVVVRDLATGAERPITSGTINIAGADWADDRSLVVATNPPDLSALWIYSLDGGAPRRLTLNPAEFQHLVAGGGGMVGFESHNYRHTLAYGAAGPAGVPEPIETRSGLVNGLNVSGAGDITFARAPGGWGPWDIWVKRRGEPARQVTRLAASYAEGPRWSPDGHMIAFEAVVGASTGVYVMSGDGSALRRVTARTGSMAGAAWTADGRNVVYPMLAPDGWRLSEAGLDGAARERPLDARGWITVRSDGRDLYGLNLGGGVWKLGSRPVLVAPEVGAQHAMEWDVGAGRLTFIDRSTPGAPRLVSRPLSGGRSLSLAAPRPLVDDPSNTTGVIGGVGFDPVAGRPVYVQAAGGEVQVGVFHLRR